MTDYKHALELAKLFQEQWQTRFSERRLTVELTNAATVSKALIACHEELETLKDVVKMRGNAVEVLQSENEKLESALMGSVGVHNKQVDEMKWLQSQLTDAKKEMEEAESFVTYVSSGRMDSIAQDAKMWLARRQKAKEEK